MMINPGLLSFLGVDPSVLIGNGVDDGEARLKKGDVKTEELVSSGAATPEKATLLNGLFGQVMNMDAPVNPGDSFGDYLADQGGFKGFMGGVVNEPILNNLFFGKDKGAYEQAKAGYATDLAAYKAYQTKMIEQQFADQAAQAKRDRMSGLGAGLRDAFATQGLEDDLEAVMAARAGGMDLADIKHFQNMVGQSYQDPSWETKFDNGILVRYNKNSNSPAQPVLGDDGGFITEKMDGDMRKTAGWFKRAVPALENMHKLEDRGVTLPREVLTLMQRAQDADGIFQPHAYDQLINKLALSKDQKQYLRTAQDLAMIQLRKESGAAIGVQEMFNELNQNVMLSDSDMNDEAYEYQRGARGRKYRALAEGMPSYLIDEFKDDGYFDTLDKLRAGSARVTQDQPPELLDRNTGPATGAPEGIDQVLWDAMTDEQRKLWD